MAKSALAATMNAITVGSLFPPGHLGWGVGALLLALGHGMVLGLAVVTLGIQALRLHYLEFYSKFYPKAPEATEKFRPSVKGLRAVAT